MLNRKTPLVPIKSGISSEKTVVKVASVNFFFVEKLVNDRSFLKKAKFEIIY